MTIESRAYSPDRLQMIVDWYQNVLHVRPESRHCHVIVVHSDKCIPRLPHAPTMCVCMLVRLTPNE